MEEELGEAAAEALETPPTEAPPTDDAPAESGEASYDEIWAKHMQPASEAEPVADDNTPEAKPERDEKGRFLPKDGEKAPEAEVAEEDPDETPKAEPERPKNFSQLPREVREVWDDMPEPARDAIAKTIGDTNRKALEATRMANGLSPIRDELIKATKELPELANLKPHEAAGHIAHLAKVQAMLVRDPAAAIAQVAQDYNVQGKLMQMWGGQGESDQQQNPQMLQLIDLVQKQQNEIKSLRDGFSPDIIRGTVEAVQNEQSTLQTYQTWAADKQHVQEVEGELAQIFIPAARQRLGDQAQATDILDTAYNMALSAFGLEDTPKTPPNGQADRGTRQFQAAQRAKSVNVASRGTRPSPLSEQDEMAAAYDRVMRS